MKSKMLLLLAPVLLTAIMIHGAFGAVDSWSGKAEKLIPFSAAITAGTSALVCTASTGVAFNVRAVCITNTASGFVRFYSGSVVQGSKLIGAFGVIANTPLVLNEDLLGQGIITHLGEGLYVDATTGTVSVNARVRLDPVSPN